MIIIYTDYYNNLLAINNKSKKIKDRIGKLYIWCFNDYLKSREQER